MWAVMEVESSGLIVQAGIWTFQYLGDSHENRPHVSASETWVGAVTVADASGWSTLLNWAI